VRIGACRRVLIHAAVGRVGYLAGQIAKARGAYVIGTRQDKREFLRELGAEEVIDYSTRDFVTAACDIDVVLDPISGYCSLRSLDRLKRTTPRRPPRWRCRPQGGHEQAEAGPLPTSRKDGTDECPCHCRLRPKRFWPSRTSPR
jgi:Zinc-binding dehydrogenase